MCISCNVVQGLEVAMLARQHHVPLVIQYAGYRLMWSMNYCGWPPLPCVYPLSVWRHACDQISPGLPHLCLHTTSNHNWSWQRLLKPQWLARVLLHLQSTVLCFTCIIIHPHVPPGCLQVGGILQEPWSALCIWYHLLPWLQPHWEVCNVLVGHTVVLPD